MEQKIFEAKDYLNRQDLEKAIKGEVGNNIQENKKIGHLIKGKRAELKKFQLSDLNSIFGVKVETIDFPTIEILKNKVKKKK